MAHRESEFILDIHQYLNSVQIKTTMRYHFTPVRMAAIQKSTSNKCWRGCGERGCFFYDPADVGNLISGSSAFSKINLNIWKFTVNVLLKPGLENLSITLLACEIELLAIEHSLALPFFGIGMKTDLFQSCGHCWVFQICWHIECSTFTTSSLRIWNSSTGIHHLH